MNGELSFILRVNPNPRLGIDTFVPQHIQLFNRCTAVSSVPSNRQPGPIGARAESRADDVDGSDRHFAVADSYAEPLVGITHPVIAAEAGGGIGMLA
jgi:hypothetical protein